MLLIKDFLSKDQVNTILSTLNTIEWKEGINKDQYYKDNIKRNKELRSGDDIKIDSLIKEVASSLISEKINEKIFINKYVIPRFNKSADDGFYGAHADAAMMGSVRADLAMTVWLSDEYEGGELIVYTPEGTKIYKESPGTAIIYPAQYVHQTTPVTEGERICCITWIQSYFRDKEKRDFMARMVKLAKDHKEQHGHDDQYIEMTSLYNNLMRIWIE